MTNVSNRRSMMGLFSGNTCIRSHQVRFVLREKGITTDIQNVDGKKIPEDLISLNPYASIPYAVQPAQLERTQVTDDEDHRVRTKKTRQPNRCQSSNGSKGSDTTGHPRRRIGAG